MLMPIPVLSIMVLIFILWLQYEIRKSSRFSKKATDRFWDKEKQANLTRKADITDLNYITLSTQSLPLSDKEDQTINSYRDSILKLADKKIINLTGYTNTELKGKYGAANIQLLTEYDNNYLLLVSMLQKWGQRLYDMGYNADAVAVLEYAVSCHTDVPSTYRLLATLYTKQNTSEKVHSLITKIASIELHDKEKLIQDLNKLIAS